MSDRLPHFVIAGAPKAGTTALHAALATHPQLYLSPVKEPKYYLTDGRPPSRDRQRGLGDAHSAQEWVWRREEYQALFDAALEEASAARARRSTSTTGRPRPPGGRRSGRQGDRGGARPGRPRPLQLVAPAGRRTRAGARLRRRRPAGGAADRRRLGAVLAYLGLGRYGEQLRDLYRHVPRERVLLLRYRQLVDTPRETLDRVSGFLGVAAGLAHTVAPENVKPFVADTARYRALSRAVRAGAALGASVPPEVWRQASRLLIAALHAGRTSRSRRCRSTSGARCSARCCRTSSCSRS